MKTSKRRNVNFYKHESSAIYKLVFFSDATFGVYGAENQKREKVASIRVASISSAARINAYP